MRSAYYPGQTVEAAVEHVLPFGVFARLADGTRAYIRRRELALDQDVTPATVVAEGETISASVLNLPEGGKYMELSRRATLPDPWPDFARQIHVGDVVQGTVVRLSATGAFVRLAPGVDGFVPLAEMAPWAVEKPEDLLWVGDEVKAVITRLELATRKLRLSIRAYLKTLEIATGLAERLVLASEAPSDEQPLTLSESDLAPQPKKHATIESVLVVDDNAEFRQPLADWLSRLGCRVTEAGTIADALQQTSEQSFQVILTDLNLPDGDGLELAQRLYASTPTPRIGLMSTPDWLAERSAEIESARLDQLFIKPLDMDEVVAFLSEPADPGAKRPPRASKALKESATTSPTNSPLATQTASRTGRLQATLKNLTEKVRAEKGIVFAMESDSRTTSIVAQTGLLPVQMEALYGLTDSPVKDVMVEAVPVFVRDVSSETSGRFHKLAGLLPFKTYLGVPIEMEGEIRYAAFFFHSQARALPRHSLQDALTGAVLLGAMLEFQRFDEHLRSVSSLLLTGEIAQGFSHEMYNKVSGLELVAQNLISHANTPDELHVGLDRLSGLISDIKTVAVTFQQITHVRTKREPLDVNEIVRRADALLRPLARKERVTVALHLDPNLPPALGYASWLQQIFLNLMLNAVQQIALKADKHRLLEVRTTTDEADPHLVKVHFADSGPGIHTRLEDRIFALGFTTRPSGTGLGLFLARGLLEGMGGRVRIEESFMLAGTTFLVELLTQEREVTP